MNKFLSKVLASILAVAMVASFSFVETPEKAGKSQLDLVSIKAVDVQNSVVGIRSYADIVDTERAYQVSDVIFLATTVEVKNIALSDYKNLDSIKNKNLDLIVGSPDIDLSFSKTANPVIISSIYSGYSDQNIGMIGVPGVSASASEVIAIKSIADYDKAKNEVTVTFRGRELNTTNAIEYANIGASIVGDKISIPALRSTTNKTVEMTIGSQKYSYKYDSPAAVQYSLILTGVTKDNAGKPEGEFYAKLMIKSAEEFVDFSSYLIDFNGNVITNTTNLVEFVDYVKVDVDKLEVEGGYNVYRYSVPSSGLVNDIPIRYIGDASVATEADKVLAFVNPAKWDYNTSKSPKTRDAKIAGAVNSTKGLTPVNNATTASDVNIPTTASVYTTDKTYYAPYYYNGIALANVDNQTAGDKPVAYRELGPAKASGGENIMSWNNNDLKINMTVPTTAGFSTTFSNNVVPTPAEVMNAVKNNGVKIARTPSTLPTFTKNWASALADYNTAYASVQNVIDAYTKATAGTDAAVVTAIAIGMDNYNANAKQITLPATTANATVFQHNTVAVAPKAGTAPANAAAPAYGASAKTAVNVTNANVIAAIDTAVVKALGATSGTVGTTAVKAAEVTLKAEWDAYFVTRTKTADPKEVKEGRLPASVLAAINNLVATPDAITEYYILGTTVSMPAANAAGPAAPTQLAVAAPVDYATSVTDAGTLVGANVAFPVAVVVPFIAPAATATEAPIVATAIHSTNNYFVAYQWEALPAAVLNAAEAKVTYTLNGTNVTVNVLPSTANVTKAVTEKWVVTVDYGTRTQQATSSSGTAGTQEISISGFFSPASTGRGLDLPADTEFIVTSAVGTNPSATIIQQAATVLVKGTATTDISSDNLKYQLWLEKNADGTINRVGILLPTNSTGNQPLWAAIATNPKVAVIPDVRAVYTTGGTAQRGTPVTGQTVVDNNGIVVYTITEPVNDRPVISIATEKTYFAGDDGYGIALFENKHSFSTSNITNDNKINNMVINRVYRSNNENFSNVYTGGFASTSSDMINGIKFFGLDASFGTTYKVIDADFDKKGAAAVYTDEVTGKFKYGVIQIVGDEADDPTVDTDVEPEEDPTPEETTPEEDAAPEAEVEVANPKTGDASANVAIALAASAMIAAAGLAFVLKKKSN